QNPNAKLQNPGKRQNSWCKTKPLVKDETSDEKRDPRLLKAEIF
ncbi:878_t:CDS:1, partial [Gigaspora rosea]